MSQYQTIRVDVDHDGVARLTLNRAEARNAMSQEMIGELGDAADKLGADPAVRVVILAAEGAVFCAGGDLKGMQAQITRTRAERIADARELAKTLARLDQIPKLTIARVQGSAFGGGLGLISICDIAIGVQGAKFALTEVRLGLIPATISPYVVARMGVPNARRFFLNAREMTADEAVPLGLLSEAVSADQLDAAVERQVAAVLQCAPGAVARAKELIRFVSTHDAEANLTYTAERLADAWESEELGEGIAGFLMKRKPAWNVQRSPA